MIDRRRTVNTGVGAPGGAAAMAILEPVSMRAMLPLMGGPSRIEIPARVTRPLRQPPAPPGPSGSPRRRAVHCAA